MSTARAETTFSENPSDAFIMSNFTTTAVTTGEVIEGITSDKGTCIYKWNCTEWNTCLPSGNQTRNCTNIGTCLNTYKVPKISQNCTYVPSQLFDVKFTLWDSTLYPGQDLDVDISFISFGKELAVANLTYMILDLNMNDVYKEYGNITVQTEAVLTKKFANLNLSEGTYTLLLTVKYGDNVRDEFRQNFTVKNPSFSDWIVLNKFIIAIGGIIIIGIMVLIHALHKNRFGHKKSGRLRRNYKK